jgi:hypothetical protein
MGVWRTSIFSEDTASDVRGDYRDLVGNGLAGHETSDKILREYYRQGESEMGVAWLALAATQRNCGRLEERVKVKALEIIESGSDWKRWTDKAFERKRGAALSKLREQLLSPQPAIPKPFRSTSAWELGELIAYRLISGKWIVLRVTDFSEDKGGVYPQCEILDWIGDAVPAGDQLEGLSVRMGSGHIKHEQVLIGGPLGFKGGGLPFALWRTFDQHLETYYGLR